MKIGYLNGLFVLARSIGLIGHALDQKRLQQPLYRHPWDEVRIFHPCCSQDSQLRYSWPDPCLPYVVTQGYVCRSCIPGRATEYVSPGLRCSRALPCSKMQCFQGSCLPVYKCEYVDLKHCVCWRLAVAVIVKIREVGDFWALFSRVAAAVRTHVHATEQTRRSSTTAVCFRNNP